MQHNADFLIKDGNGFTALEIAEKCGQVKCAELIKDAAGKCYALLSMCIIFYNSSKLSAY